MACAETVEFGFENGRESAEVAVGVLAVGAVVGAVAVTDAVAVAGAVFIGSTIDAVADAVAVADTVAVVAPTGLFKDRVLASTRSENTNRSDRRETTGKKLASGLSLGETAPHSTATAGLEPPQPLALLSRRYAPPCATRPSREDGAGQTTARARTRRRGTIRRVYEEWGGGFVRSKEWVRVG